MKTYSKVIRKPCISLLYNSTHNSISFLHNTVQHNIPPTWRRSFMLSSVASLHLKYSDYNPPIFVKNFSVKQGRIQEFVKGGGAVPPVPFLSPYLSLSALPPLSSP